MILNAPNDPIGAELREIERLAGELRWRFRRVLRTPPSPLSRPTFSPCDEKLSGDNHAPISPAVSRR